ncbi:MAG: 5-formyltetrahydrofolate cyclo-ligase [Verrucomicrobiales bacterium]|nr:5-formyltetrahydrofolate cyclo-ligase [Verrucomicrobiales bacterium]
MKLKVALRTELRTCLRAMTPAQREASSASLCRKIRELPDFQHARVIALFHPTATEPDLLPLLESPGKVFLFPLCHADRTLTWHRVEREGSWISSAFGIPEPDPARAPAWAEPRFDLILVPGLAFSADGHRLGHGAGFYDRFLASIPASVPTVGVCFSCQIKTTLPVESHDLPVQRVLHS